MKVSGVAAVLGVLLALPPAASAQVVRVAGTIRDDSGRPIRGATIVAANPDQAPRTLTASTDERGRFGMIGLRRGRWVFTVEAPGFETRRFAEELSAMRPNARLDVRLSKGAAPAPPPALSGIKGSEVQLRIDAAEARARADDLDGAIQAYEDLLARVPALTLVYLRLGELHERRADVDRALGAYRQAAAADPANRQAGEAIERLTRRGG